MIYFIPAWYRKGEWKEREEVWYIPKRTSAFDDTVKQIQLFSRNALYPYKVLLLHHAPNFRRFLHRQSIYRAEYWSCFDAMQCIKRRHIGIFSFRDLKWPKDVTFLYTPFAIDVLRHGAKYAKIEFGDEGHLIRVEMYQEGQLVRQNIYDDRGFLSLTILYREGQPYCEQYLDEAGVCKFTRFFVDNHVEINGESGYFDGPKGPQYYEKFSYRNLEEMITEVLRCYLEDSKRTDIFCVALDQQHMGICKEVLCQRRLILSIFRRRFVYEEHPEVEELLRAASYIVSDSGKSKEKVQSLLGGGYDQIKNITPYDFRVDTSISQEFHVRNVMVTMDQLSMEHFRDLLKELVKYLKGHEKVYFQFFTRKIQGNRIESANGMIRNLLEEIDGTEYAEHFSVEQCRDEMSINRRLREKILLIDLQELPDHFLEMSALSMGIPQLVSRETTYVQNYRNGHEIKHMNELCEWIDYYLSDLSHLNAVRIESYKMGVGFSTEEIKQAWLEVIQEVEGMVSQ